MHEKYSRASNLVGWRRGVVWHDPPLPGWEGCGKVTSVFGVVICVSPTAWSTTASQAKANHIANVFFQLLDNDGDGTPDDPAVVHMLIGARMFLSVPYTATEVLTAPSAGGHMTQTTAIDEAWPNSCDVPSNRGASNTDRSTWAAAVDTSSLTCDQNRDASTEEILHLITAAAAWVYPDLWGSATGARSANFRTDSDYTSAAGAALKAANGNCGNGATADFKSPSGGTCVGNYAYDDDTCTTACLVVEGIYWASVTYMGGLYTLARSKWASGEWLMATPEANLPLLHKGMANVVSLQTGSPAMYALISDTTSCGHAWLPSIMPDGKYTGTPIDPPNYPGPPERGSSWLGGLYDVTGGSCPTPATTPAATGRGLSEGVFAQYPTRPTSSYTVEACASIAGLSDNKRAALAAEGLTRCVNALGVLLTSNAACNCDNNLLFAANYVSEILDTDLDGAVDLLATFNTHLNNFDGDDGAKPLVICGATQAAEELTTNSDYLGYGMSCQAWNADMNTPTEQLSVLKEEVFHLVQQFVWAYEYPAIFGLEWSATHCTALKAAQCIWWQHPENVGCSDSSGSVCSSSEEATQSPGCTTEPCLSYNKPGQCYPNEETCADPSCDCIEWFHKLYFCYIEDSGCYVYPKAKQNGFPENEWQLANKAAYKSAVETKLGLTDEGRALLAVIDGTYTYKLPKLITGTYTALTAAAPPPATQDDLAEDALPSPSPSPQTTPDTTPDNTPAPVGGGHCRMITLKTQAAATNRIPYPNPNAKGFCMDRKIHRGVVLAPKKIKLTINQRLSTSDLMPATKLSAWQAQIGGEFERMDDRGTYTWGRPVYKRTPATDPDVTAMSRWTYADNRWIFQPEWDIIKWDSLKMHWVLYGSMNTITLGQSGYEYETPMVSLASDAAFPTSGRWSATGFSAASSNGIEDIVVTTLDATPPSLCGDGVVQAGEDCDDGNLLPADGCSPACKTDATDATMVLITDHRSASAPSRRRLSDKLSSLSSRLDAAHTCLSNSKDTDGDGTADCLDQCPYDPNAQLAKDCPVQLDVEEDPVKERLLVSVEHAIATEVLLEVRFGPTLQSTATVGPVAATSRDEAGHGRWSLSVHTPGWHTGQPFTVRAKTYTDGMPSVWSNGICSRPGDAGCPRA
jgi:cysteine-rich repeat protein